MKKIRRLLLIYSYVNKKWFTGKGIRWMIQDKKGKHTYCDQCGNIANAVLVKSIIKTVTLNIPLCKKHYSEKFPEAKFCPDKRVFSGDWNWINFIKGVK